MANFIAIKVRLVKIWDAGQRVDKGGKAIGVCLAFVDVYTCLITKVRRRFENVYIRLNEDRLNENQYIAKFYIIAGVEEMWI